MAMDDGGKVTLPRRFEGHIRSRLAAGFLVMIPIIITFLVLKFLFDFVEDNVRPLVPTDVPGRDIQGLAFVSVFVILYLVGLGVTSVFGRKVVQFSHSVFTKIPIVRPVYTLAKQATDALSTPVTKRYSRVVFLEWPRPGVRALGFVTGYVQDEGGKPLVAVYIPTVPNPTSGMLAILPEKELVETDLTVEEAMKIVLSGGLLIPDRYQPQGVEEKFQV